MSDFQQTWDAMRRQFVVRARERLCKMSDLVDAIRLHPTDERLVLDLQRDLHWLVGVGGTYKLPELTVLGERGEEMCDRWLGWKEPIDDAELTEATKLI